MEYSRGTLSPLFFRVALIPLRKKLNAADFEYQVQGTERKISHLLYIDEVKLLGRSEDDLGN